MVAPGGGPPDTPSGPILGQGDDDRGRDGESGSAPGGTLLFPTRGSEHQRQVGDPIFEASSRAPEGKHGGDLGSTERTPRTGDAGVSERTSPDTPGNAAALRSGAESYGILVVLSEKKPAG